MEENVRAAIDAYRAGAAVWHVHAREKDGLPSKDPYLMKETIDRVLDKCPDVITSVIPYVDYGEVRLGTIKRCVDVQLRIDACGAARRAELGPPSALGSERRALVHPGCPNAALELAALVAPRASAWSWNRQPAARCAETHYGTKHKANPWGDNP
jgi:hypothetical protein